MKTRALSFFLLTGITLGMFIFIPTTPVQAQCGTPNYQACPPPDDGDGGGGKKKRTPSPYPSYTPTPTSTLTQTPTAIPSATSTSTPITTATPVPGLIQWIFASGPRPSNAPGGFACPPYVSSIPLGAGLLGLGLLILTGRARILRGIRVSPAGQGKGFPRAGDGNAGEAEAAKAAAQEEASSVLFVFREVIVAVVVAVVAVVAAIYSGGQGLIASMMEFLKISLRDQRDSIAAKRDEKKMDLSARDGHLRQDNASIDEGMAEADERAGRAMDAANASLWTGVVAGLAQIAGGLTSIAGQGSGPAASGLVGTGAAGIGAGLLGSALLAGLLGFDCISVYVVLPSGAALGVLAMIAAALLSQTQETGGLFEQFELIGPVQADGSPTGSAGPHKGKDLE